MIDETLLLEQLAKGSTREKAFTLLVREYQEPIYWHIRRMVLSHNDTDDILQNTFLKAWAGISRFRGDCKISTWLYKIATNETLTFLDRNRTTVSFDVEGGIKTEHISSDSYFDGNELELHLQKAIALLPPKQRLVFNMKYFQAMKYEEMSQILGTSVGALKASYHHAVNKITRYFESLN